MIVNDNLPYFSICIPVYNGEAFVANAVESVLRQTSQSWVLTIIDNKSTDRTWPLVQRLYSNHPSIRMVQNDTNLGMLGNLNRCLEEATGEWLGILPADDSYVPHALETIYAITKSEPKVILWMHSHLVRGANAGPNACIVSTNQEFYPALGLAENLYLRGNIFGELSSYFVRRSAFQDSGTRFIDGTQSVDVRFWIRLLHANPAKQAIYWPEILAHVLQHTESGSSLNQRSGIVYSDLFQAAGALAELGWSRRVLIMQYLRLLKCWCKFGGRLPAGSRQEPVRALKSVLKALLSNRNDV